MNRTGSSRRIVFLVASILLPAVLCFSVAADLPHVAVLTAGLLLLAALSPGGWCVTDRTVTYSIIVALILTAFGNYLAPIRMERFGFMAYFLRPGILISFLFYAAALTAGFRRRGNSVGLAAAAALLADVVVFRSLNGRDFVLALLCALLLFGCKAVKKPGHLNTN